MDSSTHTPDTQPEAAPTATTLWLYIFGFVVCSILVYVIPAPYSTYLLVILVLGSMAFGVYRLLRPFSRASVPADESVGAETIAAASSAPEAPVRVMPAFLARLGAYRSGFAVVFALLGFALMIAAGPAV